MAESSDVAVIPDELLPTVQAVFGAQLPLVTELASFLGTAGLERGLMGPRELPRLWDRHLLNCGVVTELLPSKARVVDVGSGAGLPGLVIAVRRPDVRVDLVESLQRRVDFLAEAVDLLQLGDRVRVIHGRAEDQSVVSEVGGAAWVTARAVAPLDRLARWCLPLLAPGGSLLAMKGESAQEEIEEYRLALTRLGVSSVSLAECGVDLVTPATRVVVATRADVTSSDASRRPLRASRSASPSQRRRHVQ